MAPSAIENDLPVQVKSQSREPLKPSGALKNYESFDVTPVIGREFPKARLVEWLNAPNSDELLRDLAITSESCVCCTLGLRESIVGPESGIDRHQSPSVAWSFSAPRVT